MGSQEGGRHFLADPLPQAATHQVGAVVPRLRAQPERRLVVDLGDDRSGGEAVLVTVLLGGGVLRFEAMEGCVREWGQKQNQ